MRFFSVVVEFLDHPVILLDTGIKLGEHIDEGGVRVTPLGGLKDGAHVGPLIDQGVTADQEVFDVCRIGRTGFEVSEGCAVRGQDLRIGAICLGVLTTGFCEVA